jgi:hypothetical protein
MYRLSSLGFCILALTAPSAFAGVNLNEFPLRVHIVENSNHAHYRYRTLDWVDGDGRADLFENSLVALIMASAVGIVCIRHLGGRHVQPDGKGRTAKLRFFSPRWASPVRGTVAALRSI